MVVGWEEIRKRVRVSHISSSPLAQPVAPPSIASNSMSPSSTSDSPHSATATMTTPAAAANVVRPYPPLPNRDFTVEIPPQMPPGPNGANTLKSPTSLKSAATANAAVANAAAAAAAAAATRPPSFSREGILGAAQKTRNLSQPADNRPEAIANGIPKPATTTTTTTTTTPTTEESINPLKRRNTDATVDYPRRRATIAVGELSFLRELPGDYLDA
jgi:hypothetical protein